MHVLQQHKTGIRISGSNLLLFNKTPKVVSSVPLFRGGNIFHRDTSVVLFCLHKGITAMETGGLGYMTTLHTSFFRIIEILHILCLSLSSHYGFMMTLHTSCFRIIEILHILCLSLSSHYGFKTSSGRVLYMRTCSTKTWRM